MKSKNLTINLMIGALIFLFTCSGLFAQGGIEPYEIERVGLSGWQFLKINGSARQAAMAGAFTALSEGDAGAIFGNPAALVDVENFGVSLSRVNWIADIGYQSVAVAKQFGNIGVIGFSVVSVDMGDIEETINSPIAGENRTEAVITGNTFTAGDIAVGISYAKRVTDRLAIGANVRWIREKIADVNMSNVSIDFGTVYYTGFKSLRFAMVARNFGPDTHLVGWSEEYQAEAVDIRMPLDFRVGIAMDFFESEDSPHFLTVSLEGTHPNDGPEKINTGLEYTLADILTLRAGYRMNYDEESFTFGGGLGFSFGEMMASMNYAYVDFGRLEKVHMFSLGFSF
jgi:hypothetical protein